MGVGWSCLDENQYVILDYPTGRRVRSGPGCIPFCCARRDKKTKVTLANTKYLKVKHLDVDPTNEHADVFEIVSGPRLYQPDDPYAEIGEILDKIQLAKTQYIVVVDERTGDRKTVQGPTLYTPTAYEKCSKVAKKPALTEKQYIIVKHELTGEMHTVQGPTLYTPDPYENVGEVQDKIVLNNNEYVYITHEQSGSIDIVVGPQTIAPAPHDKISKSMKKIVLKKYNYVRIVDNNTGVIRVERGPGTVILEPYEVLMGSVEKAVEINEHTAVYIVNNDDGSFELIQMGDKSRMFFPTPTQDIVEVRQRIRLEQHEVVVIVDKDGRYHFMKGVDETRSFFVPPYCHLLEQEWSTDIEKSHKTVKLVSRFDTRPQYMDFEFLIRTQDNVEIIIDLNFYWQIIDVEKMVSVTSDAPEDICKHAMSQILSEASRKEMKAFMESFNEIVQQAVYKDDTFYKNRGVIIHGVEITGRRCKDSETEKTFHNIIKEKTNRIKNMEKQAGENEVKLRELEGQIKAEELQGELLKVKKRYIRDEASADGACEADKITNFLNNLPTELSSNEKLAIYFDRENTERVKNVIKSNTTLYVTPEDLDFKITNINYNGVKDSTSALPIILEDDSKSKKKKLI